MRMCEFLYILLTLSSLSLYVINCQQCGTPFTELVSLISDPSREQYSSSPWHVAIYNIHNHILICGGTIISPQIVLSAAVCFYNQSTGTSNDPSIYETVVSKFTLDYNITDNEYQRVYKIKEIKIPAGYYGRAKNFANDIAILILYENVKFSNVVLPACLDLDNPFTLSERTHGKIVGWGFNRNNVQSDMLQSANLPYISYSSCLQRLPQKYKEYITFDKFCAGDEIGPEVRVGDFGGGIVFRQPKTSKYYVRGVTSSKNEKNVKISFFTNISSHAEWIKKIITKVNREKEFTRYCTLPIKEPDQEFKVECDPTNPHSEEVPDSCTITAGCKNYFFQSTCKEGFWSPPIPHCEIPSKPLQEGSVFVRNNGGYVAKFTLEYTLGGERFTKESGKFIIGVNKEIKIPIGATEIRLKVEEYWFINSRTTIFTKSYTEPVRVCFEIYGTTLSAFFKEVPCT